MHVGGRTLKQFLRERKPGRQKETGKAQSKEVREVKPLMHSKGKEIEMKRLNILAGIECWSLSLLTTISTN